MGRILAIDFGVKRTGLAVSDPLRIIAGALETVDTKQLESYIKQYCSQNDVSTIVVGKPSQMNGSPSETMRYIEPLVGRLRHAYPDKEVVLYDERYIADYCAKEDVTTIVVGKPSQMNGEKSETMRYIEPLVGRLRHNFPDKEIVMYDERFTSVLAQRTIRESGIGKMARRDKALFDKVAATIILQSYMDSTKF